ncbi:hypothetical protein [Halanaerobacter jeridensis]|uniref:Uncharacterized protein n=1 Tax=Halanaerobacter jeridensis TaxID=706427 RepID=A0A938XWG9_9FIRM|nr:hypothetical protein [Halanaerobacter jeridensis]MBM7557531.1 hypothetical protein [Halanaerobacter jeridensis]
MKSYKIMLCLLFLLLIATPIAGAEESNSTLSNNILVKEARRLQKMGERIQNEIERPLSLGEDIDLSFDIDWSSDFLVDTKLRMNKEKREYVLEYAELKEEADGENYDYQTTGYATKLQVNNLINEEVKLNFGVIYSENDYREANDSHRYTVLRAENILKDKDEKSKLRVVTDYAIAVSEQQENFQKIKLDWQLINELSSDEQLIYNLKTGITTKETPRAYRFKVGGYNYLNLLGQEDEKAGDVFVANSFKYQNKLLGAHKFEYLVLEKILGVAFVNISKTTTREELWHGGLEVDMGLGLNTELKLGEIKAGLEVDDIDSSPQFHLKFKEDF